MLNSKLSKHSTVALRHSKTCPEECRFDGPEAAVSIANPTVATTSIPRREEIARLAERHGLHIIDDDCYRLMRTRYLGPSYRALCPDFGWYITSPSKSLTAALRIGCPKHNARNP